jgi:hypothetical protein
MSLVLKSIDMEPSFERISFVPHPRTLTCAGDYEYWAAQVLQQNPLRSVIYVNVTLTEWFMTGSCVQEVLSGKKLQSCKQVRSLGLCRVAHHCPVHWQS